jgi:hypothetical protein
LYLVLRDHSLDLVACLSIVARGSLAHSNIFNNEYPKARRLQDLVNSIAGKPGSCPSHDGAPLSKKYLIVCIV